MGGCALQAQMGKTVQVHIIRYPEDCHDGQSTGVVRHSTS